MNNMDNSENSGLPFPESRAPGPGLKTALMRLVSWRNLVRLTLYFIAIALPVVFYLRTYDSAMIKVTTLQLGALAALAIWMLGSLAEGRFEFPEKTMPFIVPALLLLLWNALRFAFSAYRCGSLVGFITQEAFLTVFILTCLNFSRRDLRQAVMVLLGGWLITVLYGLCQYVGLDPFVWKGAWGGRVFSTFGNPNMLAAYLLMCLPAALMAALDSRLSKWMRGLAAVGAVLSACALAWTRTHFEMMVFAAEIAVFMILVRRILSGGRRRLALGLAGLCLAACFGFWLAGRIVSPDQSWLKRKEFTVETWKGTAALIKERPWLGTGPGSFFIHYPAFRRSSIILNEQKHNTETDHPENELLQQWAEGGLPGMLLWLWLFGIVLRKGWRLLAAPGADPEETLYAAGIYAGVVVGVLLAFVSSLYTRFPAPGWLLFFMAGLLGAAHRCESDRSEIIIAAPLPAGWRYVLFVPVLIGAGWLARGSIRMFNSDIEHNTGIFYAKQGNWDTAMETFDREAWGAPSYLMGRYFKGNVLNDRNAPGDVERAVEQYRYVRSLAPNYVQVHYQEAVALCKLGRLAEARERLEAEIRLDPVWEAPWDLLAKVYRETGEPAKAAAAAQRSLEVKALWKRSAKPGSGNLPGSPQIFRPADGALSLKTEFSGKTRHPGPDQWDLAVKLSNVSDVPISLDGRYDQFSVSVRGRNGKELGHDHAAWALESRRVHTLRPGEAFGFSVSLADSFDLRACGGECIVKVNFIYRTPAKEPGARLLLEAPEVKFRLMSVQ